MKNLMGELAIEVELRQERASALKRIAHALEHCCAELRQLEAELETAPPAAHPSIRARHEEVRELARKQLWYLIVQREAIGLRQHDDVYEIYRVPRSLTV